MKILLLRNGRLGDMVMAAPAIRYLIDAHPNAQFTLATSSSGAQLYRNFDPRLTDTWIFRQSNLGRRLSRLELSRWLKKNSFDRTYCFESDVRYHRIFAGAPGEMVLLRPERFHLHRHSALRALQFAGHPDPLQYRPPVPLFPVTSDGAGQAKELLARLGIGDSEILVGLHPTFGALGHRFRYKAKRAKRWPATSWAKVAEGLMDWGKQNGVNVKTLIHVLPNESATAEEIARACRYPVLVANEAPNMERYKALLARMNLFVAPDTGPMHLAAAMDTRVLALYGSTDPNVTGPTPLFRHRFVIVRAPDPKIGLETLTPGHVLRDAQAILEQDLAKLENTTCKVETTN